MEFSPQVSIAEQIPAGVNEFGLYIGSTARGRWSDALNEMEKARESDPLSLSISTDVGFSLYYSGKYDAAIESLRGTLGKDPAFPLAHLWLGRAYEEKGMYAEAVTEFEKVQKALPGWPVATAAIGWVYGRWGKTSEARKTLTELDTESKHRYVSAYAIALVHAGLGDKDEALRFLDLGLKERTNWMVWTAVDPRWQPVRSDARFRELLHKIGLERIEGE